MSRYSYEGTFVNPTQGWKVEEIGGEFFIMVPETRDKTDPARPWERVTEHILRPHNKMHLIVNGKPTKGFLEDGDAVEAIEGIAESYEEDYDQYLEENHHEIAQMEMYEQFRNEY